MNTEEALEPDIWLTYRELTPFNEEPTGVAAISIREKLIIKYLPLTKRVAAKMIRSLPNHIDKDDLESYAKEGLIRAIARYNPKLGVPFEAYALTNMRSTILDGLRSLDWAPRSLRKKERELYNASQLLRQELEREPSYSELALKLEVSVEEIAETKRKSFAASSTSLEGGLQRELERGPYHLTNLNGLSLDEEALAKELRASISKAVADLPFIEAVVLALFYYKNKKLADIALELNINEVKVAAIHKEAILKVWNSIKTLRNGR